MQSAMFERIQKELNSHDIVLYMKGTASYPQCSFSAYIVQVLSQLGVPFRDVNVADDGELRKALKDYADWPMLPQLYVAGEFIGGADVVREMIQAGELQELLREKNLV